MKYESNIKFKNSIKDFLAGRSVRQLSIELEISTQMVYYYIQGRSKPHPAYILDFLTILGKPWGRILEEKEVWN